MLMVFLFISVKHAEILFRKPGGKYFPV
uniref:Uncharacterized protein n=1 Tax=Klebsiella pneumoniae TaxID=573 RepID=A0A6H1PU13_KLEPN|nr:Uncharacterized protein [Klebsiella pneumoniae]QIZ18107.1 Uncharacterized protein [Klebsiella pneumoniae]